MNLSVKSFGQLAVLAVALFFFSCSEETSPLGFKNPNPKFQSRFVEIPVTSSVVLLDSVRTSNGDASNDFNRMIVGKHIDPIFGEVSASATAQIYPLTNLVNLAKKDSLTLNDSLVFVSAEIRLLVDYYVYGAQSKTTQTYNIYKLSESLPSSTIDTIRTTAGGQQKPVEFITSRRRIYFNKSSIPHHATPIATASVEVDYDKYITEANDETLDSTFVTATLDNAFGQELFTLMNSKVFRDTIAEAPKIFMDVFKGIAIVPQTSDKIIRFFLPNSTIRLTYKDKRKNTIYRTDIGLGNHSLFKLVSYNAIEGDRAGTTLDGLTNFYQPFEPADDRRYIQGATGVATVVDFSKVLEFADTIDQMLVNSAELVIKNIEEPGIYSPPSTLIVKIINDNNRFKKISYQGRNSDYTKEVANLNLYRGYVNFDRQNSFSTANGVPFDSTLNIVNDLGNFLTLNYSQTNKSYVGSAGLFFQSLLQKDEAKTPYTKVLLTPYSPTSSTTIPYGFHTAGKTLNRVSFDKDNIVLRIYYTIPTVEPNQ
ncbi:DUF4270 family protein [Pseudochryseolinea flava]|uniref:DUF4270 domain-containing protein n=1 Tax=Pseudochryseolinea flava TaxID=2059302 RepID=A0A364Y8Q5_9BACT|nr:DUF4270 family protein [Pseudochryseolinea flava]RAW03367.1 hypothetical protein DQQ10_04585 [Pseudochryseolinea flava]